MSVKLNDAGQRERSLFYATFRIYHCYGCCHLFNHKSRDYFNSHNHNVCVFLCVCMRRYSRHDKRYLIHSEINIIVVGGRWKSLAVESYYNIVYQLLLSICSYHWHRRFSDYHI